MRVLPRVKRRWRWLAAFIFLLWLAVLAADRLWPLPLHDVTPARVVVAEDGTPLWRFADAQGVWRYPVTLADVSPRYLQALIHYEDRWFWRHPGVNPFAVLRAAWQDLTSGRVISGGSTLTMQVARLLDPHPRTFGGKLRQLWRALQLEWHLSKSDILTLYLNRAPFGGTLQGIGAASWAYLGKPPARLSYGEAALLAVLPQAPSRLRPDRWPQRAQAARDKVLTRMVSQGVWPEQAVKEAMEEPVWLFPRQMPQLAPLFSRRALATSRDEKVVTTLDAGLQRQLEDLALNWKSRLPPRSSLAMVVVDHTDMKVRGWVGSADITDDSRFGHIDMVSAVRSPGSVLKPFIYAMAMDEGLIHPASLLQDVPRRFSDYRPGNFDSGFHGPVSASEALVRSLNLPAVQVLEAYGPKRFAANLRNAGLPLTLPAGAEPNLSLILGGAGARLEDIVAAYSAFARHGKAARLRLKPSDPLTERALMSPGAAWIVRRILAGEAQPVPDASLPQAVPLAWKTGTSYGYRDAWAVGLNARYLIGIWTGRPDGTPVVGQFGFASAVPLLNQVNNLLLARPAMSRAGCRAIRARQRSARGQSAGLAGRICRRATATVVVAWPAGFWMPASRRLCCCRGRRAYAGSASRCGAMNTANGWRRIVPALGKARSKSGRCRWIPGCRPAKGGARAWDRHRSHARRYRLRIPRRWCCPASVMGR